MTLRFVRRLTREDGRVETFTPKLEDGYYVLADQAVSRQPNLKVNQFYVKDPVAVAARLRRGGVRMRMCGDITGQQNLLRAREITIEDDSTPARVGEDDPFAAFSEWSEAADDAAFHNL